MKVLVDMNLSPKWAELLNHGGIPSIHWREVGLVTAPDSEIMAYAVEHHYCILTRDLDFSAALARYGAPKPSVIQIRANRTAPHEIGTQILYALKQKEEELNSGALVTITPTKSRIHILPLRRKEDL